MWESVTFFLNLNETGLNKPNALTIIRLMYSFNNLMSFLHRQLSFAHEMTALRFVAN